MSSGVAPGNPTIVSAFHSALIRQALVVAVIVVVLAIAWGVLRSLRLGAGGAGAGGTLAGGGGVAGGAGAPSGLLSPAGLAFPQEALADPEPSGRRFLRVGFGLLWVFDGLLQLQSSMPLGLTAKVIGPPAAASPAWVQHVVNVGATIWNRHPIAASTAVVWIELGIGLWLLVAPLGSWSRAAGVAAMAWGAVVWVFGEAFGGLFAAGASWMFGAPGAVLFYCFAGALLVLDDRRWVTGQVGRFVLRTMGGCFLLLALLQAWPGRGFWQGRLSNGAPGLLAARVERLLVTAQPQYLSSWLSNFASFAEAHGFAVNVVVVGVLGALGLACVAARPALVRSAVVIAVVACLTDWALVEDLGVFGGTGTDPGSMIPLLLVVITGYLALTRTSVAAEVLSPELELPIDLEPDLGWFSQPRPPEVPLTGWQRVCAGPVYAARVLAGLGAVAVMLLGAVPMASASLNSRADPIVSQAVDGSPRRVDLTAPDFVLREPSGQLISLSAWRGKIVVLTFLDPVSTLGGPVIAEELREASSLLGGLGGGVEFVAVVDNPLYRSGAVLRAFDASVGLSGMDNWTYLSGAVSRLRAVWKAYGVEPSIGPPGSMVALSDRVFVIDAAGRERYELDADPGPASEVSMASFAGVLAATVERVLTAR